MQERKYVTADQIETIWCERDCQETAINFLRDDENMCICVTDNTILTKLKHVMEQDPESYKCYECGRDKDDHVYGYTFIAPKKLLGFRTKREGRELTDEQRAEAAERMKRARESKS